MILQHRYSKKTMDYPLSLNNPNIIRDYMITHSTPFCEWHTTWCVLELVTGDKVYLPYGEHNKSRDIYFVSALYFTKEAELKDCVYTFKYSTFFFDPCAYFMKKKLYE